MERVCATNRSFKSLVRGSDNREEQSEEEKKLSGKERQREEIRVAVYFVIELNKNYFLFTGVCGLDNPRCTRLFASFVRP